MVTQATQTTQRRELAPFDYTPFLDEVVPKLTAAIARLAPIGSEDAEELTADAIAQAWIVYDRTNGAVPRSGLVYYTVQRVKCGRRSTGDHSQDVYSPMAWRKGIELASLDYDSDRETCDSVGEPCNMHESMADKREAPDTIASRRVDWSEFGATLDFQQRYTMALLSAGYTQSEIADQLGCTAPAVDSRRHTLARRATAYFGAGAIQDAGNLPGWRKALRR